MAKRYSGNLQISVIYDDHGHYRTSVSSGGKLLWRGTVKPAPVGFGPGVAYDSSQAYDEVASSAIAFADDEKRGIADEAEVDENMTGYLIRRTPRGKASSSSHATRKKSPAQLQREINEALAKPVTASKETSVLPPSVRVARAGLEAARKHGLKNMRYGLYRHAGDRAPQWGNFTGTPEHVITAVVQNDKNTASQEALVRALKWKR